MLFIVGVSTMMCTLVATTTIVKLLLTSLHCVVLTALRSTEWGRNGSNRPCRSCKLKTKKKQNMLWPSVDVIALCGTQACDASLYVSPDSHSFILCFILILQV